jgi:predicted ATPase
MVKLNQLTVLTGINGNGKSTAIQALLFLRRTVEHCAKWDKTHYDVSSLNGLNVELNGVYCLSLGNSNSILPFDSEETRVAFGLEEDFGNRFVVAYDTNTGKELWLTPLGSKYADFSKNPLHYQEFYYLNAERIGPRLTQNTKFYDYPNVGNQGEYTAQVISDLNYEFKIDEDRINKAFLKGNRFEHHINSWLEYILSGVSIHSFYDEKTHTARVEVESPFMKGSSVVPTNTGFGISYSLPIIVTGLIAQKDRIFIVENPEAHLHPSAQSRMGYFLGIIANSGVRVVVETHSDHIINGIQIAVAQKNIDFNKVTINYFRHAERSNKDLDKEISSTYLSQPVIVEIELTKNGELTEWPSGFFDQSQIDFAQLFRLRKS